MGPQIVKRKQRVVLSLGMPHSKDTVSTHACREEMATGEAHAQHGVRL